MTEDRNDSTNLIDEPDFNLPSPRFDERATANAQPVQPIPRNRVSPLHKSAASLHRAVTGRSWALVLVVIAGLVTGTLGGMAGVKERQVSDVAVSANDSVSESASDSQNDSQNEEPQAQVFGVTDLRSASRPATRLRKGPSRARSNRARRAYLVDVLR